VGTHVYLLYINIPCTYCREREGQHKYKINGIMIYLKKILVREAR
jgi:hypothetical protein